MGKQTKGLLMRDMVEHRIMDLKLQNVKMMETINNSGSIGQVDDLFRHVDRNKGGIEELTKLLGYIAYEPIVGQSIQSAVTNSSRQKQEKVYI